MMTRLIVVALLLLGAAHTAFSRNVDKSMEDIDVELENVENFGDVERKLDKLFDTFDDVIAEHKERVSNGETPNDDAMNDKLFEVIEDAEDLDDDMSDLINTLDEEGGDGSEFEDEEDIEEREGRINDDLDIMQADANLLVSDATYLVNSVDTNPDGSRKAYSDPIIKVEMERVKEKAESVLRALDESEKKVKRKRKRAHKGKSYMLDQYMEGAQGDQPDFRNPPPPPPSPRTFVAPDLANGNSPPPRPDNVIDVGSPAGSPNDFPALSGPPNDPNSPVPVPDRGRDGGLDHGSSDPTANGGGDAGSMPPGNPDIRFRQSGPLTDTSSGDPGSSPDGSADPDPAVLARLEARRLEIEREEVRQRLEMARAAAMAAATQPPPPPPARDSRQNAARTVSDSSSRRTRYMPADFDENFGRSNRQYYNLDGLENYLEQCTDCVGMSQQTTCPLNSQVLELKKWANELQELLSFGCKKPESCTLPGICCVNNRYPFEQTVVQMTQMMKDVYNLMQDRCSRGCFGDGDRNSRGPNNQGPNTPDPSGRFTDGRDPTNRDPNNRFPSGIGGINQDPNNRFPNNRNPSSGDPNSGDPNRRQPGSDPGAFTELTWTMWGEWTACDVTCDQGIRERRRTCPNESHGRYCQGDGVEIELCSLEPCCVDGNWTEWSSWSSCSATCGRGSRAKTRTCTNPSPNDCGQRCVGSPVYRQVCDSQEDCCVDGDWAQWSRWSQCSATCGQGVSTRRRGCTDPAPNSCGDQCFGDRDQSRPCGNTQECCVHGNWGSWTPWNSCSATCGGGNRARFRRCDNPSPNFCGMRCPGFAFDSSSCNEEQCCVDGNWGSWGNWESCSTSCGRGNQLRRRRCDNPAASSCGQTCQGRPAEVRDCNEGSCCVNGNWGNWQRWSQCSVSCGSGTVSRTRACDSPPADWCGERCLGPSIERDTCDTGVACRVCVDGNWGTWETWSTCTASCGQGTRQRSRTCDRPPRNDCGMDCFGSSQDMKPCDSGLRAVDGNWGTWTLWSSCSASCGPGQRERMRDCDDPPTNACGRDCFGDPLQLDNCDDGPCIDCDQVRWSLWASWSRCSATCGNGLKKRTRRCNNPYPTDCLDQNYCLGPSSDEQPCGSGVPCCDDVLWSTWSAWSECSSTCGSGVIERARKCLNAKPGCEDSCRGDEMENLPCRNMACCDLVQWTSWSQWGSCSATCGFGVQERMRDCTNPFPDKCSSEDACVGIDKSERSCDSGVPCCVDGNWGTWSLWSSCSVTCGFGTIQRRRQCDNPPRNFCGQDCPGRSYETDVCEQLPCITCVDGNWGMWQSWSRCSVSCGGGSKERRRSCNDPPRNFCGQPCEGREFDTDNCNDQACQPDCVHGNWGSWGNWSPCPTTCGRSIVERFRSCDSPAPNVCGDFCQGNRDQATSRLCGPLPIDGNWSPWSSWSVCSASCGSGQRIRSRICNSPSPNVCGETCRGLDEDIDSCDERPCEDECAMREWTEWGRWGACSTTCGFGVMRRSRYCEFLTFGEPGKVDCGDRSYENCLDGSMDEQACTNLPACPGPSQWTTWGACSVTCGDGGVRERVMMVMSPDGRFEVDPTQTDRQPCNGDSPDCPTWGPWGPCSATCRGVGQRERSQYIRTALGTLEIDASKVQTETCRVDSPECPPALEWGMWGACSVTCRGSGVRERRIVFRTDLGSLPADTNQVQTERCEVFEPECSTWGQWGPCSSTCRGEGMRERTILTRTNLGSLVSDSSRVEREGCPTTGPECPSEFRQDINAFWGTWEKWCPCDCRTGKRSRRRECQAQDPVSGNVNTVSLAQCQGEGREERTCDVLGICPECVITCQNQPDGVYASCSDCAEFIRCQGGRGEENALRCSKPNTQFDGFVDKCVTAPSPSCSLQECVTDCTDQVDGDYHSCRNCSSFVRCENGLAQEIACPDVSMEFNGHFGTCIGTMSPTCKRPATIFRSVSSTGVMVSDASADEYYDEKHGLNPEERREMYEEMRKKTNAELRELEEEEEEEEGEDPFDIQLAEGPDDEESIDVQEGGFFENVKNFIAGATGMQLRDPDCVTSCDGLKRGRYPSCRGCQFYWKCLKREQVEKECARNKLWDNKAKRCIRNSSTCPGA